MSKSNLVNAGLFQMAWFACVVGGASGTSLWGGFMLAVLLAFAWCQPSLKSDLVLALACGLVGMALDTLWIVTGVLAYGTAEVAPPWIVMLWVGVGLTLNHSLSLFAGRPLLGGVLAAAAAPLSYVGGERLGGVQITDPWMLGVVSVAWFGVFTLAFAILGSRRRRGFEVTEQAKA